MGWNWTKAFAFVAFALCANVGVGHANSIDIYKDSGAGIELGTLNWDAGSGQSDPGGVFMQGFIGVNQLSSSLAYTVVGEPAGLQFEADRLNTFLGTPGQFNAGDVTQFPSGNVDPYDFVIDASVLYFSIKINGPNGGTAYFKNTLGQTLYLEYDTVKYNASHLSTYVPGPIVGAGIPGLILACGGLIALARRRRKYT